MRFYTRKKKAPSVIIVSLIDILAILLIFFIVTTTFQKNQPTMKINLPDSKTAEAGPAEKNAPVLLEVKNADSITLDGKPVALATLADTLKQTRQQHPDKSIAMKADREAPFGVVVQVLDALKQAGISNIPAFTQPPNTP